MKPQKIEPSLEGFRAYAKIRALANPDEPYDFFDETNCACAQYLQSIGRYSPGWVTKTKNIPINQFAFGWRGRRGHTWGALAQRLDQAS